MSKLRKQSTTIVSFGLMLYGLFAPPSLAAGGSASSPAAASPPSIEVTYVGLIDGNGHWKIQFQVTNVGAATLFTAPNQAVLGEIQSRGKTNVVHDGGKASTPTIEPGMNHTVEVLLSDSEMASLIGEEWRYSCHYAEDGVRTRISTWQWGSSGPGDRANKFIPNVLKGMPLKIDGSTAWLPPPPVEIVDNGPRYIYMGPDREPELIEEPDVVLSTPPMVPTNSSSRSGKPGD